MTTVSRPFAVARHPDPLSCDATPAPALEFHRSMPGYRPTRVVDVPELTRGCGVGRVVVKDESRRFDLPAFKVLGASWAVNRAITERAGRGPAGTWAELRAIVGHELTLVTATDGNHGRALARLARLLGVAARIYLPGGLPDSIVRTIADEGAEVIDTRESYDRVVARAADEIAGEQELLIQDTSWPGYQRVPGWIVDGYASLFAELDEQLAAPADVVVVPTGVGSLLQAALQHYRAAGRSNRPAVLAVEPVTAACVTASLAAGHPVSVDTSAPTAMAGLNCGTVSHIAWPVIRQSLDAGIGVTESETTAALDLLRDNSIEVGACGAASAAGLQAASAMPEVARTLGLHSRTRVVLLSTEGPAATR